MLKRAWASESPSCSSIVWTSSTRLLGIDRVHGGRDGRTRLRGSGAVRTRSDIVQARHLGVRDVERRDRLGLREAAQLDVADDADDLAHDARGERQLEALADGVFARPEAPGHGLADEHDGRRLAVVRGREVAPAHEADAQRLRASPA